VLDPNAPGATALQEKLNELEHFNHMLMKRANDNAGGSLIVRGLLGQMLPTTPRMVTDEMDGVAGYWTARSVAEEARATGSVNYADMIKGTPIRNFDDLKRVAELTNAWMQDPSGDQAKVWMAQNNPALVAYTQGKSFWGPSGPPPEVQGFDQWIEQLESGDREAIAPEVFMGRLMRARIAMDREIAILTEYGNDPNAAAQAILLDYGKFQDLTEDFDMHYDALDFYDEYLFNGEYARYRRDNLDEFTLYEAARDDLRLKQQEVRNVVDLLEYANLTPSEHRQIRGILTTMLRDQSDAVERLAEIEDGNPIWQNPREQIVNRYFEQVADPYYAGRNEIFATEFFDNKDDRRFLFDSVRIYENEAYMQNYEIEGHDGKTLAVPAPMVRQWNGYSQQERQERLLAMIAKKPEWLNVFEADLLVRENSDFTEYLPHTIEKQGIYDQAAKWEWEIREFARQNPTELSQSQRDKAIREVREWLETELIEQGRGAEVLWRRAMPIQQLSMGGMLPQSLEPVVPYVNQIVAELAAADKSPTTNEGRIAFMWLADWMENDLFVNNPQSLSDYRDLGIVMYDEPVMSAVHARLLQDDLFGELG
jgi:hypothetical protein